MWRLFQAINSFVKLTNMVGKRGINILGRLCHVHGFFNTSIKESIIEIELTKLPPFGHDNTKHYPNKESIKYLHSLIVHWHLAGLNWRISNSLKQICNRKKTSEILMQATIALMSHFQVGIICWYVCLVITIIFSKNPLSTQILSVSKVYKSHIL